MDRTETIKIMAVLRAAYPQYYAKQSADDLQSIVTLWAEMFADEAYDIVAMATKALIKTRASTFPPGIGEISEKIMQITIPEEMTAQEAWALVLKALRNSAYNSAEEFAKLPPVVQQVVGSASQLREWALMDSEVVNSVVASNFQRSYNARVKSNREYQALPSSVKGFVAALAEKMDVDKPRLDAAKPAQLEAPQEDQKTQSVILMLNRYRDRMRPEQYAALREQAERGGTNAVLQELRTMLGTPGTIRREA